MADLPTGQSFTMYGTRQVLELAGGAVHIEQQVIAIERAALEAPHLTFDLARALIESVCKTILGDRGVPDADSKGLKDLLRKTYDQVQLVPEGALDRVQTVEALRQTMERLDDVIACLSRLRKGEGLASHGRGGFTGPLDWIHGELAARAADAVVCFLYKAHKANWTRSRPQREEYGDRQAFNGWIDEQNEPVKIFELQYLPSEVLFFVDHEAYRNLLPEFEAAGAVAAPNPEVEL
jgi:Abortive infection C-terminus